MYLLSIYIAKIISLCSKLLNIGSGNTWPGHIVMHLNPTIWKQFMSCLPKQLIFISGTNGKTTTAKLTAHILTKDGKRVLYNASGANLLNGILSTLLLNTDFLGRLKFDVLVLEVDEFTLPELLKRLKPTVISLLNISRDQLDRHWETDIVYEKWLASLKSFQQPITLVLDDTHDYFHKLSKELNMSRVETLWFNGLPGAHNARNLNNNFNNKNVNCSVRIAESLGINSDRAHTYLNDFSYAYGRGEKVSYQGKSFTLLLAKNPASLNYNLEMLVSASNAYDTYLFILNDNIPDGHDVSWIYDVFPEQLKKAGENKKIYVSGIRALDMAVRLNYAGLNIYQDNINVSIKTSLDLIVKNDACSNIMILPNYSAMLSTRKILVGRRIL